MPSRFFLPPTDPGYAELGRAIGAGIRSGTQGFISGLERRRAEEEARRRQALLDERYEEEQRLRRAAMGYFDPTEVFETRVTGGGSARDTLTAVPIARAFGDGPAARDLAGDVMLPGKEFVPAPVELEEVTRPEFSPDPAMSEIASAMGIRLDPVRAGNFVYVPSRDPDIVREIARGAIQMRGQDVAAERGREQAENALRLALLRGEFDYLIELLRQTAANERSRASGRGKEKTPEQEKADKMGQALKALWGGERQGDKTAFANSMPGQQALVWATLGRRDKVEENFNRWWNAVGESAARIQARALGLDPEELRKALFDAVLKGGLPTTKTEDEG